MTTKDRDAIIECLYESKAMLATMPGMQAACTGIVLWTNPLTGADYTPMWLEATERLKDGMDKARRDNPQMSDLQRAHYAYNLAIRALQEGCQ